MLEPWVVFPLVLALLCAGWFRTRRLRPDRRARICERLRAMAMRLPSPRLTRSGAIPTGDYAYALELDNFRAIIGRCNGSNVASRRSREVKAG